MSIPLIFRNIKEICELAGIIKFDISTLEFSKRIILFARLEFQYIHKSSKIFMLAFSMLLFNFDLINFSNYQPDIFLIPTPDN
ncbi:hypothetical protein BpHYR1_046802 [Brachionus plicatilis]|uniref:Uncharacterized protein n=1 Tax=Brachionus plicatilis TaxID=10195 RepID=A0A3M7QB41_BRAPC|nr:hypothetical protein BpHYR1_046802 [Brachionus plicatilis]